VTAAETAYPCYKIFLAKVSELAMMNDVSIINGIKTTLSIRDFSILLYILCL
jgi:hypothetical protein